MTARRSSRWSPSLLLALLTLAALALRLLALGSKSLLTDEGSSYYFSQLPLATLLWRLCDPHPPGYYLFLRVVAVAGHSEAWLRWPSALAGALAVPLTWLLAREAMRPLDRPDGQEQAWAALLAAGLVAFAPLHVWYSQEARPYALLATLALLLAWAGLRWWLRPSAGAALLFLLAGWAALFVEYGTLLAWGGLNLFLLAGWPWRQATGTASAGRVRAWLALQGLLLLPFAIWWLVSPQRAVLAGPSYQAVFLAVRARSLGLALTPQGARTVVAATLGAIALLGVACAVAVRSSQRVRHWLGSPLVAALLVGLVLLLAAGGVAPQLYTVKRHLTVAVPPLAIAASWAVMRHAGGRARVLRVAMLGVLAACLLLSLLAVLAVPKPAWREATAALAGEVAPEDAVWVDELDVPVFAYYWQDRGAWQPLYSGNLAALDAVPEGQRAWLVGTVSPYRDLMADLPPDFAIHRQVAVQVDFPGIALRAYDYTDGGQPVAPPSQAMRWGLDLPSPLDTSCTGR